MSDTMKTIGAYQEKNVWTPKPVARMGPVTNAGHVKRSQLIRAEANLRKIAAALVQRGSENMETERRLQRAAKTVWRAKLGFLKARRWVLLDIPDHTTIQTHSDELTRIAAEEQEVARGGWTQIMRSALKHAKTA